MLVKNTIIVSIHGFLLLLLSLQPVSAQNLITIHEGIISIIRPDGAIIPVGKGDALPNIFSGSIIDLLGGSVEISLTEGSLKTVAMDSVAMISPGNRVIVTIYPDIKMVGFYCIIGRIDIITGNVKTSLIDDQDVQLALDKFTGTVSVQSVKGDIISYIGGASVLALQYSKAQMSMDPLSQKIKITSAAGIVEVSSVYNDKYTLIPGIAVKPDFIEPSSRKTVAETAAENALTIEQAAAEAAPGGGIDESSGAEEESAGDESFFADLPSEEPPEPEVAEASPYLP
jgi:hypothetical protein